MSHKAVGSDNVPTTVPGQPDNHEGQPCYQDRQWRLDDSRRSSNVRSAFAQVSAGWLTRIVRTLICTCILVGVGCGQGDSGPQGPDEEGAAAELEELLKRFPVPPPDTPEQIQQKEAIVEENLPKVYELLEEAKTDPTKLEEAVEMSMGNLTLLPGHRAAKVAFGKARLARFFVNEAIDENGKMFDQHHMGIDIRSGSLEMDRLRENYEDLSEDELQICQEIYFNRARMEAFYGYLTEDFNESIKKLMSVGFSDVKRLKTEPRFESFFTDPTTAPVLQAAIAQMEASAEDVPVTDTSEDEASPLPE